MQYFHQVIVKRWLPILKEYERTKAKVEPRPFKFVKDLCKAHHISSKELVRYYRKMGRWWQAARKPFCQRNVVPDQGVEERQRILKEI